MLAVTLYQPTVLALKRFVVEKEQIAPVFYFKLASFCRWGRI